MQIHEIVCGQCNWVFEVAITGTEVTVDGNPVDTGLIPHPDRHGEPCQGLPVDGLLPEDVREILENGYERSVLA